MGIAKETSEKREKSKNSRPNQVAAEKEHVMVRGLNKGKEISRTVVVNSDENMDDDLQMNEEDHHQDPPWSKFQFFAMRWTL